MVDNEYDHKIAIISKIEFCLASLSGIWPHLLGVQTVTSKIKEKHKKLNSTFFQPFGILGRVCTRRIFLYKPGHCQKLEGWSCGAGVEVMWSRCSFNLCVAPSYRNRGVLLFWEAGVNVCPEMRCRVDGELRIQMERVTEIWLGILVNYKLKFNYWLIYGKGTGMNGEIISK